MSVLNMPVVCADFGDIKSYFIDGHDLEYYKPGDVASLNHKITLLLDNPQHAEKLSKNASKTVTKVLDRNYWGFKLLNELNSL